MNLLEGRNGHCDGRARGGHASGLVLFCTGLLAVLLAGCASQRMDSYFMETSSAANVYVSPKRSDVTKIAILPFRGPTELIGSSVSDMFVTEMLRANKYTLVERSQMAGVLSETELALAGLSETKAVEVARMLGADCVVIGTVDEYSTQARKGKTYAVVGVSTRMIDCATGQILWSADLAKMADKTNIPLAQHGRAVVHEITSGLYQNWVRQKDQPVERSVNRSIAPDPVVEPAPLQQPLSASDMGLREVTLSWKTSGTTAKKVRIERSESISGPFAVLDTVGLSRGSFCDRKALTDATVYYYRSIAIGPTGLESEPSAVVESMTAPPPDPPGNVTAEAPSSRCVALSWVPPRSEGVAKYRVERAEPSETPAWGLRGETESTCFVDGGKSGCDVKDNTRYLYRVTAINRVGAIGAPSADSEVETLPPPAVVADFFATPLQVRCVPLSWTQSSEDDVVGYEIERLDNPDGRFSRLTVIREKATTKALDGRRDPGDLADDRIYAYRIRAFNNVASYGEWTEPVEANTRPAPPVPTGIVAQSGLPRSVQVSWTPSEDEKVTGYVVERSEGGNGAWKKAGATRGILAATWLDRDGAAAGAPTGRLADGMPYAYRVAALNTAEVMSPWSEVAMAETKVAPTAPSGVVATDSLPGKVAVAWSANLEADIEAYVVESRNAGGARWREVGRTATTRLVDEKLDDGERRVYRVKAVDVCTHESAWSGETSGSSRPLPPSPSGFGAEWKDGAAWLSWIAPRDGMTEFRIYRKGFLSSQRIATSAAPAAVIGAEVVGKKATLYVTAVDEEGLESQPSEVVEISPM